MCFAHMKWPIMHRRSNEQLWNVFPAISQLKFAEMKKLKTGFNLLIYEYYSYLFILWSSNFCRYDFINSLKFVLQHIRMAYAFQDSRDRWYILFFLFFHRQSTFAFHAYGNVTMFLSRVNNILIKTRSIRCFCFSLFRTSSFPLSLHRTCRSRSSLMRTNAQSNNRYRMRGGDRRAIAKNASINDISPTHV